MSVLRVEGVAAAGEFRPDGSLVNFKANMEMAGMSAQFCATVSMLFGTLSGAFTPEERNAVGAGQGLDVRGR